MLTSKKIPTSIDEDATTNGNDSLLNESNRSVPPVPSNRLTNGHHNGKTNGHENGHGLENGHTNNGAIVNDEEPASASIEISGPQKASSPLAKMVNGQNGHSAPLNVMKQCSQQSVIL